MDKVRKSVLWWSALGLVIVTANFSSQCKHGWMNDKDAAFVYNKASMPPPVNPSYVVSYSSFNGNGNENSDTVSVSETATINITWDHLKDVSYIKRYLKQLDAEVLSPVFGNSVKKLAGQECIIAGYVIPLDMENGLYALSKNTYAACFFCGAAGVETVISLKFKTKPRRYKTDEYCYMKGKLELNDTNVNDFMYIFQNTEEVKR